MRQIGSGDTPAALDLASQGYRAAGPSNFSATRWGDMDLLSCIKKPASCAEAGFPVEALLAVGRAPLRGHQADGCKHIRRHALFIATQSAQELLKALCLKITLLLYNALLERHALGNAIG